MTKGIFIAIITFFTVSLAHAQDTIQTERLIIIKPYSPTVSDAFKVKQVPVISDSLTKTKKQPEYSVITVPVASTFVPEKGSAATVETGPQEYLYDNYAVLGFGNYTRILAELYSTFELNDAQNLSFFLTHNSSQGGIDGVLLDDKYYHTKLGADFSSNGTYYNWGVNFGAEHQLINWYGLPEEFMSPIYINSIDPQQNYLGFSLGGSIEYYEGLFDRAELTYRRFGDSYDSGENYLRFTPEFGLPVGDQIISLDMYVEYLNGKFDRSNFNRKYSNLNIGAHPSLAIHAGDFTMNMGVEVVYASDMEHDSNDFFIYPKVKASYQMADGYFVPYAGVDGGLEQHTYYDFVHENPFVSPTLFISPTNHAYEAFVGAKGRFTENIGYNFKATYGKSENAAFFVSNPRGYTTLRGKNYGYGNSFNVVYDDVNSFGVHGELSADVNEDFQLRLKAAYFGHETDVQAEAWNMPELKASLNANYQITEKWSAGADLFFVGERKERDWEVSDVDPFDSLNIVTMDSYFDVNVEVGCQFNDQLSAFVKGNNLLDQNYERWLNYPVLGIQVLGGVTYQFDW